MKRVILIVVSILLLILDNTLMPFISINSAAPSLLFVFAVAYAMINGKEEALFIGVLSGILQDIYFFHGFGINSLANLGVCLIGALIGESVQKNKRIVPIVSVVLLYVLKHVFVILLLSTFGVDASLVRGLYIAIYDGIIMLFGYKYVLKLSNKEFIKRRWKF